jgi:hypothetical protein
MTWRACAAAMAAGLAGGQSVQLGALRTASVSSNQPHWSAHRRDRGIRYSARRDHDGGGGR